MAKRVQTYLEDDLQGGPADETLAFGLDGTAYEIDVSAENAAQLREVLAPYVGAGRAISRISKQAGRQGAGLGSSPRHRPTADPATIRAWARENGYEVGPRGRVSAAIIDAYLAASASGDLP